MDMPNPFQLGRNMYQAFEKEWSQSMESTLGTEWFSRQLGQYMESTLTVQQAWNDTTNRVAEHWNIPSQNDVVRIMQQILNVETKVDDLTFHYEQQQMNQPQSDHVGERLERMEKQMNTLLSHMKKSDK